jgi:uncharacterized ubiquitin-like protein YukD
LAGCLSKSAGLILNAGMKPMMIDFSNTRRRVVLGTVCATALVMATVGPVAADAGGDDRTPEEKAAALEADILELVDRIVREDPSITEIAFDGDVAVVPDGNDYRVTIPAVTALVDGGTVSIRTGDGVTFDMVQLRDGVYDLSWSAFDRVDITELDDPEAPVVTISFTHTGSEAVFVTALPTLLSANAEISDVRITDGEQDFLTLDRLALIGDGELSDANEVSIMDSVMSFIISGLSVNEPDGIAKFILDDITITTSVDRLNVSAYADLVRRMEAFIDDGPDMPSDDMPPEMYDLMISLLEAEPPIMDAADFNLSIGGMRFQDDEFIVSMDRFDLGTGLTGLTSEAATLGFRVAMEALDVGLDMEDLEPFVPRSMSVNLNIADLPTQGLNQAALQFLESGRQLGPEAAAMMSLFRVQGVLLESDARIELVDTSVTTSVVDMLVNGNIRPSRDALFGALAESRLEIAGMSDMIAAIRAMPEADTDVLTGLTLLQTMGREETRDDGAVVRTYNFELAQDGRILLNGTDLSPLLSQF